MLQFRGSVVTSDAGLLAYRELDDAKRLRHDPAMCWIVGGKASHGCAASPSQMGRFETRWLTAKKNLSALADLSGGWIDCVYARRPPRGVVLDMDSSESPTHGEQENSVWNGHYERGRDFREPRKIAIICLKFGVHPGNVGWRLS